MYKYPEWANWLARDKDGEVYAYENKPYKEEWHGEWLRSNEDNGDYIRLLTDGFDHIKWSDKEPTRIKNATDNNVGTNPNAYVFEEIMKLQSEKNAMYGNSFEQSLDEFGEVAGASQLMHKFNRYKTLVKNQSDNTAESKRDTLIDILGYTAMLIAWGDKQEEEK